MVGMLSPITAQIGQPERVDIGQSILGGMQVNQNLQRGKLQNQAIQQDVSQGDFAMKLRNLQIMNALAKKAKALPPEQRPSFRESQMSVMQSIGVDPNQIAQAPLDDASLDQYISQSDAILASAMPQQMQRVQSSQILDDGTVVAVMSDGSVQVKDSTGRVLSGQDASAAIRAAQKYSTDLQGGRAGARTQETLNARLNTEPNLKAQIKTEEQRVMAETEPQIKAAEKTATQSAEQRNIYKNQAVAAAENIPTLKRAIQLQEEIMSGGGANALRKVANYLGVSSADEGELNSLFGQNILGQLKSTFGGNPTEGERLALEQAQASFTQTGKINIRLLNNALKLADLRIRRGKQAAATDKDEDTVKYIEDALSVDFSDDTQQPAQQTQKQGGQIMIDANGNRAMVYPDGTYEEL